MGVIIFLCTATLLPQVTGHQEECLYPQMFQSIGLEPLQVHFLFVLQMFQDTFSCIAWQPWDFLTHPQPFIERSGVNVKTGIHGAQLGNNYNGPIEEWWVVIFSSAWNSGARRYTFYR